MYTIRLKSDALNEISLLNSSCFSYIQCTEEISVPEYCVYDHYFLEITATSDNLKMHFVSMTKVIG